MAHKVVELDGSQGEGGGQILRTSLALSLITGRPFRLRNIRAGRSKPGLAPQHLKSVLAAAEVGQANVKGASLGSSALDFEPGTVQAGTYHFRIGTAGATSLVLHTVYLPLALAKEPSTVTIEGGTHVSHSPCYHFLDRTWRFYIERLGVLVSLHMDRPGFYPRGGGRIQADIRPAATLHGFNPQTATPPTRAKVLSAVAGLPVEIAHRQARRAVYRLTERDLQVEAREETWPGGPGTMLGIELATKPVPTFFFALGERGKPAEAVANNAIAQAEAFLDTGAAGVDEHSADQIVLPLALASEPSRFRTACISSHLLTNVAVIQQFLPRRIECDGEPGQPGWVQID
jgi:RNA 3'-terminal phosphate cyclase (ATP)